MSKNKCVFLVLIDFSNAFPSINHSILIQILQSIGVHGHTLDWYRSLLKDWHQHVKWNAELSSKKQIKLGVFQGEGNSQILFTIFINLIYLYIRKTKLRQFADDTCLSIRSCVDSNSLLRTISLINEDLESLASFCSTFKLEINPKKSEVIVISSKHNMSKVKYEELPKIQIDKSTIEYADKVKYLGYYIDREFSTSAHINEISKKSYSSLSQ